MSCQWFPFRMLHPHVWYSPRQYQGLYCFCYTSMICPGIVCFILNKECMYTHLTYLNGNIHSIQTFLNEDLLNIKRSVAYSK